MTTEQTSQTVHGLINVRYDESTSHDSSTKYPENIHKAMKFITESKISENNNDRQLNQQNQTQLNIGKSLENEMKPTRNVSNSNIGKIGKIRKIRKIKKFVRCNKKTHLNLQTTTSFGNKLEIIILRGGLSLNKLYIKQHCQYEIGYNYNYDNKEETLFASIPKYIEIKFNFKSMASCTQYIINKKFIRFRNRGVIQTKYVSLWRMYKFGGEGKIFNIWCITKCVKRAIYSTFHHDDECVQAPQHNIDNLRGNIVKHIFSFLNGSKYHCWIHIHEVIHKSHNRSNLIGMEFDVKTRNFYIMQRSPALLKKLRANNNGNNGNKTQSVQMFKAVY